MRRFAQIVYVGPGNLYAVATDGTAWHWVGDGWIQCEPLPSDASIPRVPPTPDPRLA